MKLILYILLISMILLAGCEQEKNWHCDRITCSGGMEFIDVEFEGVGLSYWTIRGCVPINCSVIPK